MLSFVALACLNIWTQNKWNYFEYPTYLYEPTQTSYFQNKTLTAKRWNCRFFFFLSLWRLVPLWVQYCQMNVLLPNYQMLLVKLKITWTKFCCQIEWCLLPSLSTILSSGTTPTNCLIHYPETLIMQPL